MSSPAVTHSARNRIESPLLDGETVLPATLALQPEDELRLQQLLQVQFWQGKNGSAPSAASVDERGCSDAHASAMPERWELTRGLCLHNWQRECVEGWFQNGKKGVIKVVTGAGKTLLAMAIAERLQQTDLPGLRVAVVVPTLVLLTQWQEEFAARSNLPPGCVGLIGGGHNDRFSERTRVLISVLNSASKKLAEEVERSGVASSLLLIVDECHRAGAAEMQKVFRTPRAYSLGLSATPERSDDPVEVDSESDGSDGELESEPPSFEETVLGRELGSVFFEMTYAEALRRDVLPPFRIVHYGLSLRPQERLRYDRISREIKELREQLETGSRRGLALIRWCRSKGAAREPRAARLLGLTTERKRLLYRMGERAEAVNEILAEAFRQNPETKAILFHESIDEVMTLFALLCSEGYAVVAEHSEFPDALRAESLRLFRNGTARVIVSARSLIEGFNVPTADLGIIVAASASVRQRVQTLGRLLRRSRRDDGSEKQATLYVLYASGTVDELIYEKADWEHFVGTDRNDYLLWPDVGNSPPIVAGGPPRQPLVDETVVKVGALSLGEPYPGNPEQGRLYSLDTQGTVRDEQGNLVEPHAQLWSILSPLHKTGGRFRVTPRRQFVIRLEKNREGWQCIYLGQLQSPLKPASAHGVGEKPFAPGDSYPLGNAKGKVFSVLQRDNRLIAKKTSGSVRFVVPAEHLTDADKANRLRQIQQRLASAYAGGRRISKIIVTAEGHVVYTFNGQAFFVGHAPEGADGFRVE